MNRKVYLSILSIIFIAALAACGGGSKTAPPVEIITVTSGSGQSTVVSTAFANPLVATVSTGGVPNAGVAVTFTAPASGASGTFNSGSTTAMVTTDANGVATSPAFTANSTAGGPYIVTASAAGVTSNVNFTLTNTATVVASSNFAFYVTGEEPGGDFGGDFYALAGSVIIDANGNVLRGEQDFNDADFFTFPADTILSGTLTQDSLTGQGTLTLVTNDPSVGVNGTETLGVQFVNANHAQIIEFDAGETSSGSLDLQTLSAVPSGGSTAMPVTVSGNYAFAVSGVDPSYNAVGAGGVFSVTSGTLTGTLDANDAVAGLTTGIVFGATVSAPDANGRGTITTSGINGFFSVLTYYIIGPEAVRIIDMDASDSAIGSAFGQGTGTFTTTSLGPSVFSVESNDWGNFYAAAGMFTTVASDGKPAVHKEGIILEPTFSGVGDDDELGDIISNGTPISGQYTVGTNGYGSLSITNDGLGDGDISFLGIYMVDPAINLSDPNNPSGGGGALVVDLDTSFNGVGVLIPQTDPATASFQGDYSFIGQVLAGCNGLGCEYDFLGQGSVDAGGLLSGSGFLNDPSDLVNGAQNSGVTFTGTFIPDGANVGRYTLFGGNSLVINLGSSNSGDFSAVAYQASGGQLLWIENNDTNVSIFGGSIQQQNLPAPTVVKKAAAKAKPRLKK